MILAKRSIPREQIADGVILPPQRLGGGHVDQAAELIFSEDRDERDVLRDQFFSAHQLLALVAIGRPAEPLGSDDEHRRLRRHVVGGLAAVLDDDRARIATAERTEFSGEDDDVSGETLTWLVQQCVQSASAAVRESRSKDAAERP